MGNTKIKINYKEIQGSFNLYTCFKSLKFTYNEYVFFIYASISSKKLTDLPYLLEIGIDKIRESFLENKLEFLEDSILNKMKESIFSSGDFLANYLVNNQLPVDDVDFSVAFIGFYKNILYVWIDGNLNVVVYRNENEFLLLNDEFKTQFFGSGYLEPNDIIFISQNEFFNEKPDFVNLLKSLKNKYSLLIITYNSNFDIDNLKQQEESNEVILEKSNIDKSLFLVKISSFLRKVRDLNLEKKFSFYYLKNYLYDFLKRFKKFLIKFWHFYDQFTSNLLNKIFAFIYKKNSLKYKRIENSIIKKYIQYFLLIIIIFLTIFLSLNLLSGYNNKSTNITGTDDNSINSSAWEQYKTELTSDISILKDFARNQEIQKFEDLKNSLLSKIDSLKNEKNVDAIFLKSLENEIFKNEDLIYKNYSIEKVDEIYLFNNLGNVEIVDFAKVGNTLYALDRLNSRVLVSNSVNQTFDIFVTDTDLKALSQIICNNKEECYILDENQGFAILNLKTKRFSKFSQLSNVGKGAKELLLFNVGDTEYIYVLKPLEGKVIRYTRVGAGLTQGEDWNKDTGFGTNVTDFFIDGNIYELSSDGNLRKFFAGKLDTTSFVGIDNVPLGLSGNLQLVATPLRNSSAGVINRLYISDPKNARIVGFDKDINSDKKMKFIGSIKYRGSSPNVKFDQIKEMIISDDEKYLYCLSDNVIFKVIITDLF